MLARGCEKLLQSLTKVVIVDAKAFAPPRKGIDEIAAIFDPKANFVNAFQAFFRFAQNNIGHIYIQNSPRDFLIRRQIADMRSHILILRWHQRKRHAEGIRRRRAQF